MAWFNANSNYPSASHIRYVDFPKYFTWNKTNRSWHPRVQYKVSHYSTTAYEFSRPPQKVVGRMYNASPREGERYFLRTLLIHKPGADSFQSLKVVQGVEQDTFRDACCALGLLSDVKKWQRCIQEAFSSSFEALSSVFAIILAYSQPSNPVLLLKNNISKFIADIRKRHGSVKECYELLKDDGQAD